MTTLSSHFLNEELKYSCQLNIYKKIMNEIYT